MHSSESLSGRPSSSALLKALSATRLVRRWRSPILLFLAFAGGFLLARFGESRTSVPAVRMQSSQADAYLPVQLDAPRVKQAASSLKRITDSYTIVSDNVVYSRFARLYNRVVKHPGTLGTFGYDVLGRNWRNGSFSVVSVIPFDVKTGTFTMLKEYNFAHGRAVFTFPQGCYQPSKHASPREAVLAELNEEAGLKCEGNALHELLAHTQGAPQDKYQREVVHYYLCTDARQLRKELRQGQDLEEHIVVENHVSPPEMKAFMRLGMLQSNNIAGGLLAIDRLKELGLLPLGA